GRCLASARRASRRRGTGVAVVAPEAEGRGGIRMLEVKSGKSEGWSSGLVRVRRSRMLGSRTLVALFTALAVVLTGCADLAEPEELGAQEQEQPALAEALNTTPTGWWWYYGITPSQ